MTIEQVERRLQAEFPDKKIMLSIDVRVNYGHSTITLWVDRVCVENCRSLNHAIESLKEKLAQVRIGGVEVPDSI